MVNEKTIDPKTDQYLKRLVQPMDKKSVIELRDNLLSNPEDRIVAIWNGYHLNDEEKYKYYLPDNISLKSISRDYLLSVSLDSIS